MFVSISKYNTVGFKAATWELARSFPLHEAVLLVPFIIEMYLQIAFGFPPNLPFSQCKIWKPQNCSAEINLNKNHWIWTDWPVLLNFGSRSDLCVVGRISECRVQFSPRCWQELRLRSKLQLGILSANPAKVRNLSTHIRYGSKLQDYVLSLSFSCCSLANFSYYWVCAFVHCFCMQR